MNKISKLFLIPTILILGACGDDKTPGKPGDGSPAQKAQGLLKDCSLTKPIDVSNIQLDDNKALEFLEVKFAQAPKTQNAPDLTKPIGLYLFKIDPINRLGASLQNAPRAIEGRWLGFANSYRGNLNFSGEATGEDNLQVIETILKADSAKFPDKPQTTKLTIVRKKEVIHSISLQYPMMQFSLANNQFEYTGEHETLCIKEAKFNTALDMIK